MLVLNWVSPWNEQNEQFFFGDKSVNYVSRWINTIFVQQWVSWLTRGKKRTMADMSDTRRKKQFRFALAWRRAWSVWAALTSALRGATRQADWNIVNVTQIPVLYWGVYTVCNDIQTLELCASINEFVIYCFIPTKVPRPNALCVSEFLFYPLSVKTMFRIKGLS